MSTTCHLVILGASGDLTSRLLLPGLGTLLATRDDLQVRVVGAATTNIADEQWRERVKGCLISGGCSSERAGHVSDGARFTETDCTDAAHIDVLLNELPSDEPVILYCALPPRVSQRMCEVLADRGVANNVRIAVEKPFGDSLESAREFNRALARFISEDRVFRIDHFLGRATVLNLLALRFGNRVFSRSWSRDDIARIDIDYDEQLALEGRAGYYDGAGALKDMLQSHLLLVMALLMMEDPHSINHVELRDEMTSLLRATHLWGDPATAGVRARYTAGVIEGRDIPDYVSEEGVHADRDTETFAQLAMEVRDHRWAGVPVVLRSGKALGENCKQIRVTFKPVPHLPAGFSDDAVTNVLVIGLKPETLSLTLTTNQCDGSMSLGPTTVSADLGSSPLRPYGEILGHIIDGDPLLSVRGDTAEECWRIVEPVLDAWALGASPLHEYPAGGGLPQAAVKHATDVS